MTIAPAASAPHVLLVDDDAVVRLLVGAGLRKAGYDVAIASDVYEALNAIEDRRPDLVVSDVDMPGLSGFDLIVRLRDEPTTAHLPVIFLSGTAIESSDVVAGLSLGADDYLIKPVTMAELDARIERRLSTAPPLTGMLARAPGGLLAAEAFLAEADREVARTRRSGRPGIVAVLEIAERDRLVAQFGSLILHDLLEEMGSLAATAATELGLVGRDRAGRLLVLVPETTGIDAAETRAHALASQVARRTFVARGERFHVTPAVGLVEFDADTVEDAAELVSRAALAASVSRDTLDLRPTVWTAEMAAAPTVPSSAVPTEWRTPLQFVATLVLGVVLPFGIYVGAAALGIDLARYAYVVVVVALLVTGIAIWTEGVLALHPLPMPETVTRPFPPASAIIAAYLPNEAATIVDTLEAFLRVDYPNDLQVLLAYNTPRDMPIEATLRAMADRIPRLEVMRVEGSTSKAQNVNAALTETRGEFVGVFDADHHPSRDAFVRAWHWLCDDYDVVQGHCVVRNGDASWVARTVAVEFESIYAVSHPGRARLHRFGIFGGSNGYWRSELLRATRMRGSMLTEDIDSSLRVVATGHRIASDPRLYSRELAPTTVTALWHQRMRWAQGWFQVSLRHLMGGLRSPELSLRQKWGFLFLLGWRELYPWIAIQMVPIIAFLAWESGGVRSLDWVVPVFVLTTLFTLSVGPGQTLFAWILGVPEITRNRRWFWSYLVVASLLYTEFKNVINRISQVKEIRREREWKVTARG